MAWIEGIRIGGGVLQGQIIGNVGTFPHMERAGAAHHEAEDNNGWDTHYQVVYFNNVLSLQIDIHDILNNVTYAGGEVLLAAIPIYNSVGSLTGNLRIGVSKPYSDDYYTYRVRCYVTDGHGTTLGSDWGYSELTWPSGGAWANFIRNAYLAYAIWLDGNNKKYCGLYVNASSSTTEPYNNEYGWWYRAAGGEICFDDLYTTFGIEGSNNGIPVETDPEFGPASEPGGYGPESGGGSGGGSGGPAPTFDGTSDPWVDYPVKPGIAALGLVNLYKCDVGSLVNLGAELFPDIHFPTSLSDVGAVIAAVSDSIWNSKLIDYIISAHIIPVDVTGGNLTDIKVGTRTLTGILARPISNDVIEFDCGTIHIDEYYTSFVDYITRCRVYIPFYGFVDIKPEYWQSADLQLKYRFNVIDGSFVAMLYSTITRHQKRFKSLIGQYTGCSCVHVPMTGASYSSMFGGMIANAGGVAMGMASGNPAMAATSALNMSNGAMQGANGQSQMSNPYNASAGFYGHPCPYVIIERPVSHFSTYYNKEKGLPLLVEKTLGACRGFTTAEDAILDGIPCTQEEKSRIQNYLKSGVIIK